MSTLFWIALWALCVNLTGLLPLNWLHRLLGRSLALSFPFVLYLVGRDFGLLWMLFGVFMAVSLFRRPLVEAYKDIMTKLRGPYEPDK
ncbi:MAG: DUF2484 family protein [Rhodobacteraceae bacterium]|nr:DUF2484 family protein [Paracoccaceae bacterium]